MTTEQPALKFEDALKKLQQTMKEFESALTSSGGTSAKILSDMAARFTALVGQSPMAYLKRWRLQLAATLLRQEGVALSSVAERVGYESTPAFSRAFTRLFGVSPGRYRHRGTVAANAAASAGTPRAVPDSRSGGKWASAATSSDGKRQREQARTARRRARGQRSAH